MTSKPDKRPHILHIIDSLAVGGAEKMLVEIANTTDKSRFRCSVLLTRSEDAFAKLLMDDVRCHILGREKKIDTTAMRKFLHLVTSEQIDLLHVHGRSSLNFVAFVYLMSFGMFKKFPKVVFHDHWGDIELIPDIPFEPRFSCKLLNGYYVCIHQTMVESLKKHKYPSDKIMYIRNAIIFEQYLRVAGSIRSADDLKVPVGIIISNLRSTKGIEVMIEAMMLCKDLEWRLQVIGGPMNTEYAQHCVQLCKDFGIADRMDFQGVQMNSAEILKQADFAVYSAHSESGPLVLIEYVAAQLPFASTKVGTVGKLLDELGIPGFVSPGDAKGLADEIRILLGLTAAQRIERGTLGYELSRKHLDMGTVIDQWHDLYKKVLRDD